MLMIFDCDGVLIDSEVIATRVEAEMITALGRPMTPEEVAARYCGMPYPDMMADLERLLGALPATFGDDLRAEVHRRLVDELVPIDGIEAALDGLRPLGFEGRACVASSTGLPHLRHNLDLVGLLPRFDPAVFSASQVRRGKPAPDVFLYAASQMGADPADCLVVEDSVPGVEAARRAGMRVVGFVGGGHAAPELAGRLLTAGAETVFDHMERLAETIERHHPRLGGEMERVRISAKG